MKKMKNKLLAGALVVSLMATQILPSVAITANAADVKEPLKTTEADAPAAPEAWGPTPSAGQMKYYKDELSAFLHFGVNTFTGAEWGNGKEDPDVFNPSDLSTDQWIETLKDAGFKRAILTAKHHDGFALYPTKFSSNKRSVESSAWRDGKGDVVQDFVDSCKKYDMDIGFYLSPWDAGNPEYPSDVGRDYNDIYVGQMQELMEYANAAGKPAVEWWLDGANGGNNRPKYDIQRWWDTLYAHNPDIVFQQNYGAPLRWCGNESGYSADTCWHTLNKKYVWDLYDLQGQEDKDYLHVGEAYDPEKAANTDEYEFVWSISEVDVSLHSGWFWHNSSHKSVEKLMDMYFDSVGLGSPFLLNVPPNKEGRIDDADVAVLKEFREILDNSFTKNYVTEDTASAEATATRGNHVKFGAENVVDNDYDTYWTMDDGETTGSVTVTLDEPQLIDVIQIQEYIPLGQRIASFKAEVHTNGEWQEFGTGGTIGYKRLVKGSPVTADAIRVTVTDANAVPLINDISAFKVDERIEEEPKVVPGRVQAEAFDTLDGAISENKGPNGAGNLGAITNGAKAVYNGYVFNKMPESFTLSYSGEGTPEITLRLDSADGPVIGQMTVESTGSYNTYKEMTVPVTYEGEPITGTHSLVLCMNAGLNVDWFELTGSNTLSISPSQTEVYESDSIELTVTRSEEDVTEEVKVTVQDSPDSAVQGQDYEPITKELTFAPGETEKTVQINTVHNDKVAQDSKFSIELQNPSANAVIGRNAKAVIKIKDIDTPADKSGLEAVIKEADKKVESNYTPESWAQFAAVLDEAKALMEKQDANRKEINEMITRLTQAMEALTDFQYTDENPLVLPTEVGGKITTEGEFFQLIPKEGASGKRIQIEEKSICSNGKNVGYWQTNDYMQAPVIVEKAGTYTFGFRYSSGSYDSARNTIRVSGTGITDTDLSFVPNWPTLEWATVDVTVTEDAVKDAPVLLKIEAIANGGPILDQVEITLKEEAVKPEPANKAILSTVLAYAEAQYASDEFANVIDSVQKSFTAALENARVVNADPTASQEEVDAAWVSLMTEIHKLGLQQGNKDLLREHVELYSQLDLNLYIDGSAKDNFVAALEAAKAMLENNDAVQSEVDAADDTLVAAAQALVKRGDKTTLQSVVDSTANYVEDHYAKGWAEFAAARDAANAVLENPNATQEEIDAATDTLIEAMLNLRLKADKSLLNAVIAAAEGLDLSGYSKESVQAFEAALNEAKATAADESLSVDEQNQVTEAVNRLSEAVNNLKKTDGSAANLSVNGDGSITGGSGSAKTGEATPIAMAMAALLLAGSAIIIKKRR